MIDEFQDIDELQYRLMKVLVRIPSKPVHRRRPGSDHLYLARGER